MTTSAVQGLSFAAGEPAYIVCKLGEQLCSAASSRSTSPGSTSAPSSNSDRYTEASPQITSPKISLAEALKDDNEPEWFLMQYDNLHERSHQEFQHCSTPNFPPGKFIAPPPGLEGECGAHLPVGSRLTVPQNKSENDSGVSTESQQPSVHFGEDEVGASDLPSIGSMGHFFGTCKPCAFFRTKGCGSGKKCTFCHLCPEGEKLHRKKEKQRISRDMHNISRMMPMDW